MRKFRPIGTLGDFRSLITVLSWPEYGCLFWSDGHHGDCFGHYENWESFNGELADNFKRWGVEKPIVIVGSAWRVRAVRWLLQGRRPSFFTSIE